MLRFPPVSTMMSDSFSMITTLLTTKEPFSEHLWKKHLWQFKQRRGQGRKTIVKPRPQTLSPKTQNFKTKGPWADTKIS